MRGGTAEGDERARPRRPWSHPVPAWPSASTRLATLARSAPDASAPSSGTPDLVAARPASGGREAPRPASSFRPDIEGLRGLAILMVVVFHAVPRLFGGGFIGVDVFFVISGFLITGLLVRELRGTGRVDLPTFYVRRVRRLLPAMALAIGVTLLLSALDRPAAGPAARRR